MMDPALLDVYPFAQKAFAQQDEFYKRHKIAMPPEIKAGRERMAELIDNHIHRPSYLKDALIVVAVISLDPLPCHSMYGDPSYGKDVDRLMTELVNTAKNPDKPLPADLASVITLVSVIKMEQAMDEVKSGKIEVDAGALKATAHRCALNDALYLPNLSNRAIKDLYETTQFAYFFALEKAAIREKKPPKPPPSFGGPVF
ncbi:MAG: hypothetical protein ACAH83_16370 [Alphaproteobacteria bacterium]